MPFKLIGLLLVTPSMYNVIICSNSYCFPLVIIVITVEFSWWQPWSHILYSIITQQQGEVHSTWLAVVLDMCMNSHACWSHSCMCWYLYMYMLITCMWVLTCVVLVPGATWYIHEHWIVKLECLSRMFYQYSPLVYMCTWKHKNIGWKAHGDFWVVVGVGGSYNLLYSMYDGVIIK